MKQTPIRANHDPHVVPRYALCLWCLDPAVMWIEADICYYCCASDECLMTRASREQILDLVSRRIAAG